MIFRMNELSSKKESCRVAIDCGRSGLSLVDGTPASAARHSEKACPMIFVSHSSKDHEIAMGICRALEERGIGCWISSRDIEGGAGYQESVDRAVRSASARILVFSSNANRSPEIQKELALASARNVTAI